MTSTNTYPDVHTALKKYFGYDHFKPGQHEALQSVLSGHNTLVVMPTGAGKSLIYQLAAMLMEGVTLVVSPLVALMKDQADSMARRKLPATFINSSLDAGEQSRRMQGILNGDYKIVLVSPERLRTRAFRQTMSRVQFGLFAVDEAHCLSQWGHDFRPDYLYISEARRELNAPITLALTATATPRVQDDMLRQLQLPQAQRLVMGFNRPNLHFEVVSASSNDARMRYTRDFVQQNKDQAGIIYCGTRKDTEEVSEFLRSVANVNAAHYHAGLDSTTRADVQDKFLSGDLPIVVATNAFGMGIDRPDVRWVLHYNMPGTLEAYYQEAGRAGRDELPARAVMMYSARDIGLHEYFIENSVLPFDGLRRVQDAVAKSNGAMTMGDIQASTGLQPTQLRVAIEQLAAGGALQVEVLSAAGQLRATTTPISEKTLHQILADAERRQAHKRALLQQMVAYAESDACRRKFILGYFGDPGSAEAERCCDNCDERADQSTQTAQTTSKPLNEMTQAERAALIVLDTVQALTQQMNQGVGNEKMVKLLRGSTSADIAPYARVRNFGKFAALRESDVEGLLDQLITLGFLKRGGGLRPVLQLSLRGQTALNNKHAIAVELRRVSPRAVEQKRMLSVAGSPVALTLQGINAGKSPDEIAAERGVTIGTIYTHLSQLIGDGKVDVSRVIEASEIERIRAAIVKAGSTKSLSSIRYFTDPLADYSVIRCVVSAWQRSSPLPSREGLGEGVDDSTANSPTKATRAYELGEAGSLDAVPELIELLRDENGNVRRLAASALGKLQAKDAVPALLELLQRQEGGQVRNYAIVSLGRIGDARAVAALKAIANDGNEKDYNRESASMVLRKLRG